MRVDPGDFRRLYASLSDEALLEVERGDLTDVARECYEQEVAQRGLQNEATAGQGTEGTGQAGDEELVAVGTFESMEDLGFARGLLRLAEIPVFTQNEAKESGKLVGLKGPLQLFVPRSFEEQAREVLDSAPLSDEELAAQAEAAARSEVETDQED